ncbi:ATP-binding cassette domain-containing protein [Hufsiella ginkgonis]|uniref:ATP-binding cassette domain-containing protein n=1 Tax=Hufsiella ginkgonis TaxID=2695274 RepID=A0A7K1XRX5_9SPHI|nr:ATP-binding cassette domain-containing protein [Hufsiella ginkgonis]MXV13700.1 ATP-binding cassette domain-containing protein [Hufsiella ginkgonis]
MSIAVEHLTKLFGQQKAIDSISFRAEPGKVMGFLGPNGAGKSTTMRILTSFIPQTSGRATVCGFDVAREALEVRRVVGYLPEHNPLYPELYVKESLGFVANIHGLQNKRQRISDVIGLTGLGDEQHKKIGQLSKGYRQRVGLAQAIIHDPKVLILDEPTSGLDPNQLSGIRKLIRDLGASRTVVFSTHIMQEAEAVCDHIVIINKGNIVADDALSSLRGVHPGRTLEEIFISLTGSNAIAH